MRGLALEGETQREEIGEIVRLELRDAGPAVRLDGHEALDLEAAQRRAQRVARDVVGRDELALDEPPAGLEIAVEDPRAQQVGELVDGRAGAQRLRSGGHAVATAGSIARRPGSARTARPASTSAAPAPVAAEACSPSATTPRAAAVSGPARARGALSPLPRARRARGDKGGGARGGSGGRRGEEEGRGLTAREAARAAGDQDGGDSGGDRAEVEREPEAAGARQEAGAGEEQDRDEQHRRAAESRRHDALGRGAARDEPLAQDRARRVAGAGRDGERDAARIDRAAPVAREQRDAGCRRERRDRPAPGEPLAVDQAAEDPGGGGAGADRGD